MVDHSVNASFPKISDNPEIQTRYAAMRLAGESHGMAEVLAVRKFPGVVTDAVFMKDHCNGSQFAATPAIGDHYKAEAEKLGMSVNGRVYYPSLARFPGDPLAWCSGRGDVLRAAEVRGDTVEGLVNYHPPEYDPTPPKAVPVADDILGLEVERRLMENPSLKPEDVKDYVTQLRTGQIDPNPLLFRNDPHPDYAGNTNADDHLVDFS